MASDRASQPATVQQDDDIHVSNTEQPHNRLVAIAVDGSKHSEYAFHWAVKNFLRAETDQLMLIHVRPANQFTYSPILSDVEEVDRKASHELLQKYSSQLPAGQYNVRLVSMSGDAREAIAWKVESAGADVVIVGSHGRGPIRKALLGSVSDHLVKHLKVPVIVSRAEAKGLPLPVVGMLVES